MQKQLKKKLDDIEKVKLEKELETLEHIRNDHNKHWQVTRVRKSKGINGKDEIKQYKR